MPYVQTDHWKAIVKEVSDETLDSWITCAERDLPAMKEIASHGDPDSPIYVTIEREESDLVLYKEEKKRRFAQKR